MAIPVITIFLFVAFTFAFGVLHASILFRPVIRASKRVPRTGKIKYYLIDLLALVFLIQLPLVIIALVDADFRDRPGVATFVYVFLVLMMLVVWRFGVLILSRMNVVGWQRRLAFLCFALPIGLFGGFFLIPFVAWLCFGEHNDSYQWMVAGLPLVVLAIVSIAGYFVTHWVSGPAEFKQEELNEN